MSQHQRYTSPVALSQMRLDRRPSMADQPLSDVALDHWVAAAETAPSGELGTVSFPVVAQMLIAELRASRAREQELQQRIDKALAWCHKANPRPDLNGDLFSDLIAALTGTEAIRSMADLDRTVD